jgi:hypothetical protein
VEWSGISTTSTCAYVAVFTDIPPPFIPSPLVVGTGPIFNLGLSSIRMRRSLIPRGGNDHRIHDSPTNVTIQLIALQFSSYSRSVYIPRYICNKPINRKAESSKPKAESGEQYFANRKATWIPRNARDGCPQPSFNLREEQDEKATNFACGALTSIEKKVRIMSQENQKQGAMEQRGEGKKKKESPDRDPSRKLSHPADTRPGRSHQHPTHALP